MRRYPKRWSGLGEPLIKGVDGRALLRRDREMQRVAGPEPKPILVSEPGCSPELPAGHRQDWTARKRSATCRDSASVAVAVPHSPHEIGRAFALWRHGRCKSLEQSETDWSARFCDGGQPRDRLAAAGDGDGITGRDPIDELAQMGFGIRKIDRVHALILTMEMVI